LLGGYNRKLIKLDLNKEKVVVEELSIDLLKMFIGGSGLGANILYKETKAKIDPLSPDNLLIFMCGPLTGTRVPLSGRHQVITKSPLTEIYGESDVGGTWGSQLKKAGYDGIVIYGRAENPKYVWINDEDIEIRDAKNLWGKDAYETDEILRKENDEKASVACIGQAGEKLVRISAIMTDGKHGRASGRCGVGAVMGSKNLKAIIVRGTKDVEVAKAEELAKSIKEFAPMIVKNTEALGKFGTSGATVTIEQLGDLPIKNWVQGRFEEGAKKISGQTMAETILVDRYFCTACIVGCGREVKVTEGKYAQVDGAGPEYETVAMLGAMNLIDDLKAIAKGNDYCNRFGLDTISTGAVISFAFEAYEKGLINKEDTDGLELIWGSEDAMVELVRRIGLREGRFAWLLGEGVKRASEAINKGANEFAIHTKGLELPAHDPRAYNSIALGYATSNRGACHLQGLTHIVERAVTIPEFGYNKIQDRFGVEGKGELTAKMQNLMSLLDSLKLCKFILFGGIKPTQILNWFNMVTGLDFTFDEFMKAGERIYNLKRMYNVREGIRRKDDTLPKRILTLKRKEGGAADNLPPLDELLDQYYDYRGWTRDGVPKKEKLKELGLEFTIKDLPKD
jgi:aldehyde:ferredoxin oxidoreductase